MTTPMQDAHTLVQRSLHMPVDSAFYFERYPDVQEAGTAAVAHYIEHGWLEGRDPSAWFSTAAYLAQNPAVARSGQNPLYHHLVSAAHPLAQAQNSASDVDSALRLLSPHLREFLETLFDHEYYLTANPDVAVAKVEPQVHFLTHGWHEGRYPRNSVEPAAGAGEIIEMTNERERAILGAEFDPSFYTRTYSDIVDGVDALDHYISYGWREGRDPNPSFSTSDYLRLNADVRKAGMNPFLHYVVAGRSEGRLAREDLGFRYKLLDEARPLDRLANLRKPTSVKCGSATELHDAIDAAGMGHAPRFVLSISHDDYRINIGGVQSCLQRESVALQAAGFDQVHLYPATPLPCNELLEEDYPIAVLLNGESAGVFMAGVVGAVLHEKLSADRYGESFFILHSTLGHNARSLESIICHLGQRRGYFWIHDYATACTGLNLLRNDVKFCGGPEPSSQSCMICHYGTTRELQATQFRSFFSAFDLTVVAPSNCAMDIWTHSTRLCPSQSAIVPHCSLDRRPKSPATGDRSGDRPLRIAFLGFPISHKGWPVFTELVRQFVSAEQYEFHHLCTNRSEGVPVRFTRVAADYKNPIAMASAIEQLQIDIALIWSICPETFCFTAHEALAAGAAVLTNADSGNVAALLKSAEWEGHGAVLTEEELFALFRSGNAAKFHRSVRQPEHFDIKLSNVTADLVLAVAS